MHDTPPDRASGGVPQAFRLRLGWQWVPQMPLELRRRKAFLFALSTLAGMADTAGRTRFQDSGQPIRIARLAAAMGSREKDCRRYLSAAIAAGILTTEQAPRRGRTTVYVLLVPPATPRWAAALAVLDAGDTATSDSAEHRAPAAEFGPRTPEPDGPEQAPSSGHDRPNSTPLDGRRVRATDARPSSGYGGPLSSGYGGPNNPGVPKINPQEMGAVGPQPADARGHETHERADDSSPPATPPPLRAVPPPPPEARARGRHRAPRTLDRQPPLLVPVPGRERPAERPAHAPAPVEPGTAYETGWRAFMASQLPPPGPDPTGT